MKLTASRLFAPDSHNPGEHRCYYCGLDCDEQYPTKDHVKKTFTNRDIVKYPGSGYACGCCVASLVTVTETVLIDGDVKAGRGAAPRTYSWILSANGNHAFSKKHLNFARAQLLSPPEPPFSIVLADSGKKQIMFRAPVNYDTDIFSVQFEESQVLVDKSQFKGVLELATCISAAIGKKAILSPNEFVNFRKCIDYFGDERLIDKWTAIYKEPMAALASWVCKGKDDARNEHFVSRRVSTETGRDNCITIKSREQRGDKERGDQVCFDFA